jgi:hypothetical protein
LNHDTAPPPRSDFDSATKFLVMALDPDKFRPIAHDPCLLNNSFETACAQTLRLLTDFLP